MIIDTDTRAILIRQRRSAGDPAARRPDIEVTQGLVPVSEGWRGFWKRDFAAVGREGAIPVRSPA